MALGDIVFSFPFTPSEYPQGITFDGKNLWICDYEPTIYCFDRSGDEIKRFTPVVDPMSLFDEPRGITFDRRNLWYVDNRQGLETPLIVNADRAHDSITSYFNCEGTDPDAITFDGKHIWTIEVVALTIVIACYGWRPGFPLGLPFIKTIPYPDPAGWPGGLTFDGKNLWCCDYSSNTVYCIDPDTGAVIRTFTGPARPAGLAFDGKYLWLIRDFPAATVYCLSVE